MKTRTNPLPLGSLTQSSLALLALTMTFGAHAGDGVWTNAASGLNWSTAANWTNNAVADGSDATANFGAIDLAADTTIHLDSPRAIGNLVFGDIVTSSAGSWLLDNSGSPANVLTLAGTMPTITVNALGSGKSATVSAAIAGTAGLVKAGVGTLTLSSSNVNTFTGGVTVQGGSLGLNYANLASPTNLVDSANGLVVAGGSFTMTARSSALNSQTFSGLTIGPGASQIRTTLAAGNTTNSLVLGAFTHRVGGTVVFLPSSEFTAGASSTSNRVYMTGVSSNYIAPWVFANGINGAANNRWAWADTNGQIGIITGTSAGSNLGSVNNSNVVYTVTGANTLSANRMAFAIQNNDNAARTLTLGAYTLTVNGIIAIRSGGANSSSYKWTFAGASGAGGIVVGDRNELVVGGINDVTISVPIKDGINAPSHMTFSGNANTLTLDTVPSTYTGITTVNSGTLALGLDNVLHSASSLVVNGGKLDLSYYSQSVAGVKLTGGMIIGSGTLASASEFDLQSGSVSANLGGSSGLRKSTAGEVTLSNACTYAGATRIVQGTLGTTLAMSSSALNMSGGTKLKVSKSGSWTMASAALTNATLELNYGIFGGDTSAALNVGNLTLSGINFINLVGAGFPVTDLTLLTYSGKSGSGSFQLGILPTGAAATLEDTGSSVVLHITSPSIQELVWTGGDGIWQTNGGLNWNWSTATYQEYASGLGDKVTFDDSSYGVVTIPNVVKPGSITVNTSVGYTFSGPGSISGTAGITKLGNSTLTLGTSNGFSGVVAVGAGTLYVDNPNALGSTNGGTVVASGATLELGTYSGSGTTVTGETVTISDKGAGGVYGALRGASVATGSNVWAGPVILGTSNSRLGAEDDGNLTVSGSITDGGTNYAAFFRAGGGAIGGVVTISGTNNSWGGDTTVYGSYAGPGTAQSTVRLGVDNGFPAGSRLLVGNSFLDLNGHNQSSAGLAEASGGTGGLSIVTNSATAAATLTLNPASSQNFPGDITGNLAIIKQGTNAQTFSGTNLTYIGNTTISAGRLNLAPANPMTSSVTVAGGGALGGEAVTSGALTLNANATLYVDPTTDGSFTAATVDATSSPLLVNFTVAPTNNTLVLVLSASGGIAGSPANFQAVNLRGGTFYLSNGNTQLFYDPSTAVAANLVWKGNDPTSPTFWDTGVTANWDNAGSPDKFMAGDKVLFDDSASSFIVALQGAQSPASVVFSNSANAYTLSGGAILGATGLVKNGTNSLLLASANSYTGPTTINAGTLIVQNNAALGTTASGTAISGGTLDLGGGLGNNALNLGAEVLTVSGAGVAGNGAVVNNGPNTQINAVQQMVLAGNATVGGLSRWDMRGTGNTLDMSNSTLTKTGTNSIALVATTVNNPGNIEVRQGTLGVQLGAYLGGGSANTLTVDSRATYENYQTANPSYWTLVLSNAATFWAESGNGFQNTWAGPVSLQGAATLQADAVQTISGEISGPGSLNKLGANTATLTASNSYSGPTTISAGVLNIQNPYALGGSAGITVVSNNARLELQGGIAVSNQSLSIAGTGGNYFGALQSRSDGINPTNVWAGNLTIVAAGTRIGAQAGATLVVAGVIDSGDTNVGVTFRPADTTASVVLSAANTYAGDTAIVGGPLRLEGGDNRLPPATRLNFGLSGVSGSIDLNGRSQEVAGLTVVSGAANYITNSSDMLSTLTVNTAAGLPSSFSGGIQGSVALVKTGPDQLVLSGSHSNTGATAVSNGTLLVNGTIAASSVTVHPGATLGGTGGFGSAVTVNAGGTLAPGSTGVGTLTLSNDLVLAGNLLIDLDKSLVQSNDLLQVSGNLSNGGVGTLTVSNLGPALVAGDSFILFSKPLVNGNALAIRGPAGVTFSNRLDVDGSIQVLAVAPPVPTARTNITYSVSGGTMTISWPSNYLGWSLQQQTNALSKGLSTNWVTISGTESVYSTNLPLSKTEPAVFFRLVYTNAP